VPSWMRPSVLPAADCAVITEYIEVSKPLKSATDGLQDCGKVGTHGALYEIMTVFEIVIADFPVRIRPFTAVQFHLAEAPE
ncbi:hypothetical protein C7974DRAFT_284371, partial [Boeremia exigua]|uniref:uncharacterized protein n=1 Tax=Boeremia exigua TaxID=749465 RepID=UPI001E8E90FD